jgi:hypothetical protein
MYLMDDLLSPNRDYARSPWTHPSSPCGFFTPPSARLSRCPSTTPNWVTDGLPVHLLCVSTIGWRKCKRNPATGSVACERLTPSESCRTWRPVIWAARLKFSQVVGRRPSIRTALCFYLKTKCLYDALIMHCSWNLCTAEPPTMCEAFLDFFLENLLNKVSDFKVPGMPGRPYYFESPETKCSGRKTYISATVSARCPRNNQCYLKWWPIGFSAD